MKKLLLTFLCLLTISTINSQVLNQSANWPNTNWTLNGTYNAGALLGNPTLDSNFSYEKINLSKNLNWAKKPFMEGH